MANTPSGFSPLIWQVPFDVSDEIVLRQLLRVYEAVLRAWTRVCQL